MELRGLLSEWASAARGRELPLGVPVDEARQLSLDLQGRLQSTPGLPLNFSNPSEAADLLYALSQTMPERCATSPEEVLREASTVHEALTATAWAEDQLGEREGLLLSLAFNCWRAARLLGRSREAQFWEAEYRRVFQTSLHSEVADLAWSSEEYWNSLTAADLIDGGVEDLFQMLVYLQDILERAPRSVGRQANILYGLVEKASASLPPDLRRFFLGASALLVGNTQRAVGSYRETVEWVTIAESNLRRDATPEPHLARALLLRLTTLYALSRYRSVSGVAPQLEQTFIELGMQEDRVKCRLVWAASLKIVGDLEGALDLLTPLADLRSTIGSRLYGWVLAEIGDLHGIMGDYGAALKELGEAALVLREEGQLTGLAHVNSMLGCMCRSKGLLPDAITLFRSSAEDYARLEMRSNEAYIRILIAETYLAMKLPNEAEKEVLTALPVLEEQDMVADAVAALNLLREAIRQRTINSKQQRRSPNAPWAKDPRAP